MLREWDSWVDPIDLRRRVAAVIIGLATGPFRVQVETWPTEVRRRLDLAERWVESADRVDKKSLITSLGTSHPTPLSLELSNQPSIETRRTPCKNQWRHPTKWKVVAGVGTAAALGFAGIAYADTGNVWRPSRALQPQVSGSGRYRHSVAAPRVPRVWVSPTTTLRVTSTARPVGSRPHRPRPRRPRLRRSPSPSTTVHDDADADLTDDCSTDAATMSRGKTQSSMRHLAPDDRVGRFSDSIDRLDRRFDVD